MFTDSFKHFQLPTEELFLEQFKSAAAFKEWFKKEAGSKKNWRSTPLYSEQEITGMLNFFMQHAFERTEKSLDNFLRILYHRETGRTLTFPYGFPLSLEENTIGNGGLKYPAYAYPKWLFDTFLKERAGRTQQLNDTVMLIGKRQSTTLVLAYACKDYEVTPGKISHHRCVQLSICPYH